MKIIAALLVTLALAGCQSVCKDPKNPVCIFPDIGGRR